MANDHLTEVLLELFL